MRQEFVEPHRGLGRQPLQDVLEVDVGIVTIKFKFRRLDQTHECCGALAGPETPSEQPILQSEYTL
jgi:hypothetical protein